MSAHSSKLVVVVSLAGLVSGLVSEAAPPFLAGWEHRKKITIDSARVAGELTNFTVLLSITDADLQAGAKPDGADIVVTSADGTNKVSREIEAYDDSDGTLALWFKAPTLSAANNEFYLYYDNSSASEVNDTATWDDNYVLVLHLSETNTNFDNEGYDEHFDSTSYTNHGGWFKDNRGFGGGTMNTSGLIAGGDLMGYSGYQSNDQIRVDHDASLNFRTNDFTVSIWFKSQPGQGWIGLGEGSLMTKIEFGAPGPNGWRFTLNGCCGSEPYALRTYYMTGGSTREERTFSSNEVLVGDHEWHYNGMSLNRQPTASEITHFWRDGVIHPISTAYDAAAAIDQDGDEDLYIASVQGGSYGLHGFIDEVRVSNIARSSNWIATCYNNQSAPSSFHALGAEEVPPQGLLFQIR